MPKHGSFLLLPDPKLSGAAAVKSATSAGGLVPGRGTPSSKNEGNLSAFVSGRAETAETSFDLRVQDSGGIVAGATYAWKRSSEADADWRGENDRRFIHAQEDPFIPATAVPIAVARTEILYSETLDREFCFAADAGDDLSVRYRDVGEVEASWQSATATFDGGIDFNGSVSMMFAGCALPDGAFRMVVQHDNDLDVYHSDDGLNWSRVADNIHTRFAGRLAQSFSMLLLRESGGYLTILGIENGVNGVVGLGAYLTTLVSSDRGATWIEVDAGLLPAALLLGRYGPSGVDRHALSLTGVGDAGGTFIFTGRSTLAPDKISFFYRSGFGSWSLHETVGLSVAGEYDRVILGRTATHIVALIVDLVGIGQRTGESGDYGILTLDRRVGLTGQSWSAPAYHFTQFDGSPKFRIGQATATWIGTTLAVLGKRYDWSTGAEYDGAIYFRLGEAWSQAPVSDLVWEGFSALSGRSVGHQPRGTLFNVIEWHAEYGRPEDGPMTPWLVAGAGAWVVWRGDRIRFIGGIGDSGYYRYFDPGSSPAPSECWMVGESTSELSGCVVMWECAITAGSSSSASEFAVAIRSRGSIDTTKISHCDVRIGQVDATIYDQVAGATIATLTPDPAVYGATPFAVRWEFRWAFPARPAPGPSRWTCLMARRVGDVEWISTTLVSFAFSTSPPLGAPEQWIRFGMLNGASAVFEVDVWNLRLHRGDDLRQAVQVLGGDPLLLDDEKPQVVRGRDCSTFPVALIEGVEVAWGGGGGFDGDTFESIAAFQYAPENMLLGPRFEWRSADAPAASESVVLTAGSEDHARFRHSGLAVVGCNTETVVVEYDSDPAFPSPVSAGTLDLRRFDDLRISAVEGESVTIAGSATPEDGEVSSSDARSFYLRVLAVPAGATSILVGDCFTIAQQRADALDLDSGAFLPATVGATVSIYADRGVLLYESPIVARYLRATVAAGSPPSGVFRIGSLVAGTTLAFDVPLDWEHSDTDEPTATVHRSRSGISWAYVEGPPRRTVTGTVVGDAGTFRARLRNLLRATARYVERPVVLAMDDRDLTNPDSTILARLPDGIEFEQNGWRYLSDEDRWIAVGDASMTFEEDV